MPSLVSTLKETVQQPRREIAELFFGFFPQVIAMSGESRQRANARTE
ncbi:hypothetical protein [Scytonema hofmannii]|nr:hypothetical protein [Scytonema hofmannii]